MSVKAQFRKSSSAETASAISDLDVPETSVEHGRRIRAKGLLRRIYLENYRLFQQAIAGAPPGLVLELGSGGGFFREIVPEAITSDVQPLPDCDRVLWAESLPFADNSLRAIVMQDVLHHIKDVEKFFAEAQRCLVPGGKVIAIEPSSTWWAKFIWKNFHHEPYQPESGWLIPDTGPMSGANGALPWIVFFRDRRIFEQKFPFLRIQSIEDRMPLVYILSGGVRNWSLLPGSLYGVIRALERGLGAIGIHAGMFWRIELVKKPEERT